MEDKKPNTPSNSNENMSTYPISPPPISTKNFHGINGVNITSPQIASLRLKPAKSTDSLTNHPLQNFDDEESDVNSIWSSQRSRRSPSSSSTSSSSSLQPRFSSQPVPSDSVGGLMLTKLRELNLDFSGIVQMLIAKKATLLLPTSPVMPFEQIDLTFLEDHVIVSQPSEDGQKVITLNGVTGFIQQDTFKVIGLVPPEPEISTYIKENSKTRKSIFDTIIKPIDLSYDYPSIEIINKNVDILFEGMTIQIIVIDSPIRAKEVAERIAAHKAEEFKVKSPDLPENLLKEINSFTGEFIKLPPKDEETSIDKIQGLFYSLGDQFELQAELNEEKQDDNENEIDKSMNIVEKYVCTVLYDLIFCPKWSDDNLQDDILGSKIAALNFCKLCLLHLGVDVNLQQEQIDMVVKTAGRELQNLDQMKAPYEKLDTLIRCHRIVVDALEKKSQKSSSFNLDELDDTTKIVQDAPTVPSSATSPQASDSPTVPTSATLPQASDSPTVPTSATLPEASDSPTVPTSATLPEASDSPTVPTSATLPQASDSPTMPTLATLPQASDSPTVPTSATLPEASDSPTVPTSATLPQASDSPTMPTSATLPQASDSPTVPLSATSPQTSNLPAQIHPPSLPTSPTQTSSKSPIFPFEEKNTNADAILPLLIFIVVKSNPKKLISNLRFMQRYRARNMLYGEASYCLTNILAVVEYLGNMDPNDLGSQSDKLLSEQIPSASTTTIAIEQRVSRRVGQEIVGVADSGLKVITGVVDTSYKMMSRVFGYNEIPTTNATSSTTDIGKEHNVISNTADAMTQTKEINDVKSTKIIEKELAEISPNTEKNLNNNGVNSQIDEPKSLTGRLLPFNLLPRFSSGLSYVEEENKEEHKGEIKQDKGANYQHHKIAPPIKRFLDCPYDEFHSKDVQELLSDYKRLSAEIQELGLFSS